MIKRQDVLGNVNDSTNLTDSNGVSQHDQLNRPMLWEQTATVDGTHNSVFARSHFGYDNLSRLTASWRDEQAGKGEWFGYHATGQLTDVAYNADNVSSGTPQNATRTVNYAMTSDTLNRSTMADTGELSIYTPNALNQYTDLNGGGIYYDDKFNLMWTGGFSAGYDSENHLIAIGSGEDYGQFVYDGLGRCLKRTVNWETTLITYDGWQPIVEWDEWNNLKAWNVYGAGPDEILYRHDAYLAVDLRYHLDRMGNVVFILDSDGYGIERYTYDAFGTPIVTDWNGNNPRPYSWYGNRFMFTGREYFPELGLYDYRNRFYYPALGRFLQSDPISFDAGDMNLFRYCGGDPVNGIDPLGLEQGDMNGQGADAWATEVKVHAFYEDRYALAGLFALFSAAGLEQYFSNLFHEPGLREGLSAIGNLLVGENGGEAWRKMFVEPWVPGDTGGYLPLSLQRGVHHVRGIIPSNASHNGFKAWHAGSNARMAQQLGLIGAPYIVLAGVLHETPADWTSFWQEQSSQGSVNHILDSTGDIAANIWGMNVGYLQQGPAGINTAIYFSNVIPGPTDYGPNNVYQGDPIQAWEPHR